MAHHPQRSGGAFRVLGVGSPIVDTLAQCSDAFLSEHLSGAKGGMEAVDIAAFRDIESKLSGGIRHLPGGAAANTVFALANLGVEAALLGRIGDDERGAFFRRRLLAAGGDDSALIEVAGAATDSCMILITPDAERTMRSVLDTSLGLTAAEVEAADFGAYTWVYLEGFMLFSPVFGDIVRCARRAGCRIALDLASFEVVKRFCGILPELLRDAVDLVFANSGEAAALTGRDEPSENLRILAGMCDMAVVKLGADGATAAAGSTVVKVPAVSGVKAVDTTGAGDLFAAGFICGLSRGYSLEGCTFCGTLPSAAVVQRVGTELPSDVWRRIRSKLGDR